MKIYIIANILLSIIVYVLKNNIKFKYFEGRDTFEILVYSNIYYLMFILLEKCIL